MVRVGRQGIKSKCPCQRFCYQCRTKLPRFRQERDTQRIPLSHQLQRFLASEQQSPQLRLYEVALFLDDKDLPGICQKGFEPRRLDRPGKPHLVNTETHADGLRLADIQPCQRIHHVEKGFSDRDYRQFRLRRTKGRPVDRVGPGERAEGIEAREHTPFHSGAEISRGIIIEPTGGKLVVGRRNESDVTIHGNRRATFQYLGNRLHAHPGTRKAGSCDREQAEGNVVADRRWMNDRHHEARKRLVGLMRHAGRDASVIITQKCQNSAHRGCSETIAVLQRIPCPVHAWPFAVPDTKDAILGPLSIGGDFLRAEESGGSKLLIHRGFERDPGLLQSLAGRYKGIIVCSQRRATVSGYETGRIQSGGTVEPCLLERQTDKCLCSGQENFPPVIAVFQLVFLVNLAEWRQRRDDVHRLLQP